MGCDMEMSHSLTLWTQVGASLLSGNHLLQNFTFMADF